MSKIDELRHELKILRDELRAKMEELLVEQSAAFGVKIGDLLELKDGTYGNPDIKHYVVSRLVFPPGREPAIYGYKQLKKKEDFHHTETQLSFRGDEMPKVIGHVDGWRQILSDRKHPLTMPVT